MTGLAAGLALSGKTVFTYSIANFPTFRCLEQIRNDVCNHEANVTVVAVGGGTVYGAQGYTHHGIEDFAIMRVLPGMNVVAPGDPVEAARLIPQIAALKGPCYLRLGRGGEPSVHDKKSEITLGKASLIHEGRDMTFISTGAMLKPVADVVDKLALEGIKARHLSMHTLRPLDREALISAARETGVIVTVEEHVIEGGLGTIVADTLMTAGVTAHFRKIGITEPTKNVVGSQDYLRGFMGDILEIGRAMVRR
jgi:transketolase